MQALPIAPVDLPAATPSAPPAPKPGEDGLFASRLQAATRQQQTTSSPNATGKTDTVTDRKQIASGPDTESNDASATDATPAASLNGSAGAALQAVPVESQTNSAAVSPAAAPGGETAIARMLDVLSKGNGLTLQAAAPVAAEVAATPTAESIAPSQSVAGANAPLSVATLAAEPQPPTNMTQSASSQLPGSAPLTEGKNGSPQVEVMITESAQSVDRSQPGNQATAPVTAQTEASTASNASQASNPLYVQNKYGQIIAIQQGTSTAEEGEADSPATTVATGSGQRLDANSNYIRSHLPNQTPDKGTEHNNGQAAASASKPQQAASVAGEPGQPGQTFAEQAVLQNNPSATTPDSQPLVVAPLAANSPTATTVTTPGQSTVYHLASGLMVPEGTVVDQMIAHFAVNRRLDTGEVTLRLYPQELGEVRMAIKVEQDNVKAHIIAQNPQAQEMIDRHLPRLREALEQQGLTLHQIEVTVAAHDNAGGERFQDNHAWRQPTTSPHRSIAEQPIFSLEPDEVTAADTAAANNTLSVLA